MNNREQGRERLLDVASKVLEGMSQNEDFPEAPTLKKKFRCPYDGSTNVQRIMAILESASHSHTIDGKTVYTTQNSVLLNRYRPGKEPKKPYSLLLVAPTFIFIGLAMAGMMGQSAIAWIPFLFMVSIGGGAIWVFIHSCQHIEEERTEWARKVYIAQHHWHCRNCGGHFEPGRPESYCAPEPLVAAMEEPLDESPSEEDVDDTRCETALNISRFKQD